MDAGPSPASDVSRHSSAPGLPGLFVKWKILSIVFLFQTSLRSQVSSSMVCFICCPDFLSVKQA